MKRLILIIVFALLNKAADSQSIKKLAVYDSQSSYTSGVFCIGDTAVFRYSWYYQEWFPLPSEGMVRINDTIRLSAIAVYNNKINNSSGIFVFSDSVVLNYNWVVQTWFKLSSVGLPLNSFNKPDVRDLAVYGDSGSSSNSQLFALTNSGVFRYNWYYQKWSALSDSGLNKINDKSGGDSFCIKMFPNPIVNSSIINLKLNNRESGNIEFVFYDVNGKKIFEDKIYFNTTDVSYNIPTDKLSHGVYLCEIKAGKNFKTIRLVKN